MPGALEIGDPAPNFDLASTEDVVLMLRDEVPRTPVLLYFFEAVEAARSELEALAGVSRELAGQGIKTMAISPAKLEELKAVQKELGLGFPLLHDDRNLSAAYGVVGFGESQSEVAILVLVGKSQRVLWIGQSPVSLEAVRSAAKAEQKLSSTVNYPRRVINRLVDRWVN